MRTVWLRLAISAIFVLAPALPGFAGELDDYYLTAFGTKPGNALEKALLAPATRSAESAHCGTSIKHGLSRDWNKLEPATQKVLAKQLAAPVLSGSPAALTSSGGHFVIHYSATGADAPNVAKINQYTGLGLAGAADWAGKVADAFEAAYSFYKGLGYHMPTADPYDVYLSPLAAAKEYGETVDIQKIPSSGFPYASTSYILIDNDFTSSIFRPDTFTPLQSLQITSAHEFHHALQYGYSYYFDIWYAEATSTWVEGEIYPSVNQHYDYIPGWFSNSTRQLDLPQYDAGFNSQAYGRWIFNRYLVEKYQTPNVVRAFWENLAAIAPINGQDVPMALVLDSVLSTSYNSTLSADFFGFAKRVYRRDWTSHAADISLIPPFAPVAGYASYPVNSASVAPPSVTLPHYSFAYYRFTPSAGTATLTITVAKTSGIQAAVFTKAGDVISEVPASPGGTSYTVSGFNTLNPNGDEVVLLLANVSNVDGQQANFSTDGSTLNVQEPTGGSVYRPVSSADTRSGSGGSSGSDGGGKSGCFIATAAYGSYLHPKVALLRAFRDDYLLTNPPGRLVVALYYRVSPPIADLIAQHAVLRGAVRLLLAPVVLAVEHGLAALIMFCLGLVLLAIKFLTTGDTEGMRRHRGHRGGL